jgi:hypothetical protein
MKFYWYPSRKTGDDKVQMQQFIDRLNEKISIAGLVAFGGHPDEGFNIQGVYTRQELYLNFTVQCKQLP